MASGTKIHEAMLMVQDGIMSIATASKTYGIPYSTLRDKLIGRRPVDPRSKHLLNELEEKKLVEWICVFAERSMGRSYNDIRDKVREILHLRGASARTTDGRPGKDWMQAFMKRHPDISLRATQGLGKERALIDPKSVANWFTQMKEFCDKIDPQLLKTPDRLYNADETGFALGTCQKKVLAPKGISHVYQLTNNTRQQLTVLGCCSAAGDFLPPMIIYPRKRMPTTDLLQGFDEAFLQISHNGWMNSAIFSSWLTRSFAEFVKDKQKPVVLFLDGHASHNIDVEALDFCSENGIVLYGLLPQASHVMQPLDLTVFASFKRKWPEVVKNNLDKTGETATQANFARLLKEAWDICARPDLCINGFVRSGIFPFNPQNALSNGKMEAAKSFPAQSSSALVESTQGSSTQCSIAEATDNGSASICAWIKDFAHFTHKIGLEKTLKFADVMEHCGDTEEQDFFDFQALVLEALSSPCNTHISQTSLLSTPNCASPNHTQDNQLPVSHNNSNTDLDKLLTPPSLVKNKNSTDKKKKTSLSMAFTSAEYREYLRKKADNLKKAGEEKERKKKARDEARAKRLEKMKERQEKRKLEMERKKKEKEELAKLLKEEQKKKKGGGVESSDSEIDMVFDDDDDDDDEVMEVEIYVKSVVKRNDRSSTDSM